MGGRFGGAGQEGFYGVMKERGQPLIIALRLKVVNGQITEIEHVLARRLRADALKNLADPRPEFVTPLAPADRLPRQQMVNLVFSFPMFQHRGGTGTIRIYNVPGVESLPLGGSSSNLQAGEIFKIDRGRITAIEAMGEMVDQ